MLISFQINPWIFAFIALFEYVAGFIFMLTVAKVDKGSLPLAIGKAIAWPFVIAFFIPAAIFSERPNDR